MSPVKVEDGKDDVDEATRFAHLRPAVPGAWFGGERFVMMFTCNVCETRAARTISKVSYNEGVVLVRCPGCGNIHLVADRLGWFSKEGDPASGLDIVELMRRKGETVRAISPLNTPTTASATERADRRFDHVSDASQVAVAAAATAQPAESAAPPAAGPTPLDLALMTGVYELSPEDLRVLNAQGRVLSKDARRPEA